MKRLLISLLLLLSLGSLVNAQETFEPPANFPPITFTIDNPDKVANGDIYIAPYVEEGVVSEYGNFVAVFDNTGELLFANETLPLRAYDFHPYPNGHMSYYQQTEVGIGGRGGFGMAGYIQFLDARGTPFQQVDVGAPEVRLGPHEAIFLENGNAIVIIHEAQEMDMTAYGGVAKATVVTTHVQEVTPEGEVVWFWDGWEHFPLEDCVAPNMLTREPPQAIGYAHINGMTLAPDGNLIISVRHFDQIMKINRSTGEIMWRLGGAAAKHNDFTFIDDPYNGFSHQHNPTILENGHLLLFDNGVLHEPKFSRAAEYELDEVAMTARLVWSYDAGQAWFGDRQGSAQRLPNGNTLISWGAPNDGSRPAVTEVTAEGETVMSIFFPPDYQTYRAYKVQLAEPY